MCTLIVAWRVWPGVPLVVAANRDERLDRRAAGLAVSHDGPIAVLAPRDLEAGGTWLGVNARGVLSAITNRAIGAKTAAPRSRGLLVLDGLRAKAAADAAQEIRRGDPRAHGPFHLVLADADEAHLVWNDGHALHHERWEPGIHVVTQSSFGPRASRRIATVEGFVEPLPSQPLPGPATWTKILAAGGEPPIEAVCVRMPELGYGTRSSSIVYLTDRANDAVFLHAEGPPDTSEFVDQSAALQALLGVGLSEPVTQGEEL